MVIFEPAYLDLFFSSSKNHVNLLTLMSTLAASISNWGLISVFFDELRSRGKMWAFLLENGKALFSARLFFAISALDLYSIVVLLLLLLWVQRSKSRSPKQQSRKGDKF